MSIRTADQAAFEDAGRLLRDGSLVAFPTETVYGLGADATNGRAVASIFETKGRPRFNPLIVHVPHLAAAEQIAVLSPLARQLAQKFWPGPLTLVAKRQPDIAISDLVSAGLDTIALRVPAHPVAQALLAAAGRPLAAPSANRSGRVSPTTAQHVSDDLMGRVGMILDGGATQLGLESTILDVTGDDVRLLRSGALPRVAIEDLLQRPVLAGPDSDDVHPTSPGQLASHYAPNALMRLNARDVRPGEALLAFGSAVPANASTATINLSPAGDLTEAAAGLFAALRTLDRTGAQTIAVMPIPDQGLGEAINDRLRRAAAPRP